MFIGVLTTTFFIHGGQSLKEKRHRVAGLRDKFGRIKNIAVCESALWDVHDMAEMSFICTANDKQVIESALAKIVDYCSSNVDAELTSHELIWL